MDMIILQIIFENSGSLGLNIFSQHTAMKDESLKLLRWLELLRGDLPGRRPFSSIPTDKPPVRAQEELGKSAS